MSEDEMIIYLTKQNIKLKEEISNLKKKIDNKDNTMAFWRIKNRDKKERIDKAIEYIKDNVAVYAFRNEELPHWDFDDNNIQDLLKILKGE